MSLTGPLLQWGTIALALLAATAVVVGWARLAGPGVLRVAARGGVLVGVNVLVVFALLVSANRHFEFYSGWDDLLGRPAATADATEGAPAVASSPSSAVLAGTTTPTAPEGTAVSGFGGRVQQLQVTGASGTTGSALVVLPRDYRAPGRGGTTYPVLVALHGYPGDPEQWLTALDIAKPLQAAARAHQLTEPIVVIPDLADPPGRDSECLDGPAGQPQLETWLSSDLPKAVEASYRARTSPQAWAAVGFSMGGWCSAVLTMLHPQQYGAGIVLGGYFTYQPGGYLPFATSSPQAEAHDLVALAATAPPAVSVYVGSTRDDPESWPTTKQFLAAVKAPLSVTSAVQATGGHRSAVWAAQLPAALKWLGTAAPGFAPAS